MDDYLTRITYAIDYLKEKGVIHKQQDVADAMGIGKSHVSEALKGKAGKLTAGFLKRFAAAYSDYIREQWLLTGEGDMAVPDPSLRPHFSNAVSAGFLDGYDPEADVEMRHLDDAAASYDFTVTAQGTSMMPLIHPGDTLCCRVVSDRANPPLGRICVIDSADGQVVKRIDAVNHRSVTLASVNPEYPPYSIPAASIRLTAVVVGLFHPMI